MLRLPRSLPAVFLLHAVALPFITLATLVITARLGAVLPPSLPVSLLVGVLTAAGLHYLLGRVSTRSLPAGPGLRGHLARCGPAYLAAVASGCVIWLDRNAAGFGYEQPFLVLLILVGVGAACADLLLVAGRARGPRSPSPGSGG